MAKARITLNDSGPLSYHGNGYSLQRGQAIMTTKDEDIIHFSTQPGFTVDMLEGEKPKAVTDDSADDEDEGVDAGGDDDAEGPVDGELSEKELVKLNKGPLLEMATEMGAKADASMNKAAIIAAILAVKKD